MSIDDVYMIRRKLFRKVLIKKVKASENYFKNGMIEEIIDTKDAGIEMGETTHRIYFTVIKLLCYCGVSYFTFIILPMHYASALSLYILYLSFNTI